MQREATTMDAPILLGFTDPDAPPAGVYDRCIRCGLCLPSCPTYLETMTETSSPRGRISLIKAVGEGRLDLLAEGFQAQMSECLDCRACEAACPSGVRYGELIEGARAQIARAIAPRRSLLQGTVRGFLVRRLFSGRGWLALAAALTRFAQRTRLDRLATLFGLGRAVALAPRLDAPPFRPFARRDPATPAQGLALLHLGCVMPLAFPRVHAATVRMLGRARLAVVAPPDQGCCGAIAVHAGDPTFARSLAKRNIVAFERSGADVYVVNAAGCGAALKEYGHLFAEDPAWHERAQRFAARVRDVTEVLDAMELDPRIGPLPLRATYQDPCHLAHAQRVVAAPRRLLSRIPELELVEMPESALCCGSAGVYNLTQPAMAERLGQRKIANLASTDARVVVTANPGCALQLAAGLRRAGMAVQVKHVVELLDDAYAAYSAPACAAAAASRE